VGSGLRLEGRREGEKEGGRKKVGVCERKRKRERTV